MKENDQICQNIPMAKLQKRCQPFNKYKSYLEKNNVYYKEKKQGSRQITK